MRPGFPVLELLARVRPWYVPRIHQRRFSGRVAQKLAASKFLNHDSLLFSGANFIALDKGEDRIRPISIGIILRRLFKK